MAQNPKQLATFTYRDASSEAVSFTVQTASDATEGAADTFQAAVATVTNGTLINRRLTLARRIANARIGTGQREQKWLVVYKDDTTLTEFSTELPCRTDQPMVVGTDRADLSVSPWDAFKSAFEAYVKSPDGNDITVLEIILIGRNL